MAHKICPWWLGYVIATPLRRIWHQPHEILAPYVRDGMTVVEPGPGIGFFTIELATLVGAKGRVVAIDVQPKMLDALKRRASKAGLSERIITRQTHSEGLDADDFAGQVDFVLAFAVVHELPDMKRFFRESAMLLKRDGKMLLAEPSGHVDDVAWKRTLDAAREAGLTGDSNLNISRCKSALLTRNS